jgi:alkylation response protein AidB-like acyl-CoA dehydrogenase
MRLVAPWDGHGMIATQSHAFHFDGYPAMRAAWPGHLDHLADAAKSHILCCFAGVFVGIVDAAVLAARAHFGKRQHPLLPFEQVEWARAELDSWLLQQAYAGMLHAVETQQDAAKATLQGKLAITELAETVLTRICRIVGGGAYARTSPFGFWAQDVRALGFLRPPWALGFDALVPKPPRDA